MNHLEEGLLKDLINKYSDPLEFAAAVTKKMKSGELKLKTRGAANTRELIALFYKHKTKNNKKLVTSSRKMPSFKKYISEATPKRGFVPGLDNIALLQGYDNFYESMMILRANGVDVHSLLEMGKEIKPLLEFIKQTPEAHSVVMEASSASQVVKNPKITKSVILETFYMYKYHTEMFCMVKTQLHQIKEDLLDRNGQEECVLSFRGNSLKIKL